MGSKRIRVSDKPFKNETGDMTHSVDKEATDSVFLTRKRVGKSADW